jgi:hypothetical protein
MRFIGNEKSDDNKIGIMNSVGGPFQIIVGIDRTIYVLDDKSCHCQGDRYANELFTFAPTASGDVAPTHAAVLRNPDPNAGHGAIAMSIALDAKSRLYFLDGGGNVIVSRQLQDTSRSIATAALCCRGLGRARREWHHARGAC